MLNKRWYKMAIDVQDACNPLGVTKDFAEVTQVIWDDLKHTGNASMGEIVNHPIFVMWVCKIADMACLQTDSAAFSKAYTECKKQAGVE